LVRRFGSGRSERAPARAGAPGRRSESSVGQTTQTRPGFAVEDIGADGAHILVLSGELDAGSIARLESAITRCTSAGTTAITLDLSRLSFIDSSGLWTITLARRWCEAHGRGFTLVPGPPQVQEVFEVTGLIDVLPFTRDGSTS
jgi:anti-anti-sigma factor